VRKRKKRTQVRQASSRASSALVTDHGFLLEQWGDRCQLCLRLRHEHSMPGKVLP